MVWSLKVSQLEGQPHIKGGLVTIWTSHNSYRFQSSWSSRHAWNWMPNLDSQSCVPLSWAAFLWNQSPSSWWGSPATWWAAFHLSGPQRDLLLSCHVFLASGDRWSSLWRLLSMTSRIINRVLLWTHDQIITIVSCILGALLSIVTHNSYYHYE